MKASLDKGRVSLQHVGVGVSAKTLQLMLFFCLRLTIVIWRNMACKRAADIVEPFQSGVVCMFVVLVAFICTNVPVCDCEGISPERCLVWGPGLNADTVVPVRHFFIQAVNSRGENLTLSPGKAAYTRLN